VVKRDALFLLKLLRDTHQGDGRNEPRSGGHYISETNFCAYLLIQRIESASNGTFVTDACLSHGVNGKPDYHHSSRAVAMRMSKELP